MPVILFSIYPGAPLVFRCDQLRASVSVSTCAENHRHSQNLACQSCTIGKEHAASGKYAPAQHSDDVRQVLRIQRLKATTCVRCGTGGFRIMGAQLCVSCRNRQVEVMTGKNGKGRFPILAGQKLYECRALVAGELSQAEPFQRQSACSPRIQRVSGGALIQMVASGQPEVERWLSRVHPETNLIDFEQSSSLAVLAGHSVPPANASTAENLVNVIASLLGIGRDDTING
ncbi:MAG: hypothetical protein ABL923_06690 [Burkholderiaceae bacterium]